MDTIQESKVQQVPFEKEQGRPEDKIPPPCAAALGLGLLGKDGRVAINGGKVISKVPVRLLGEIPRKTAPRAGPPHPGRAGPPPPPGSGSDGKGGPAGPDTSRRSGSSVRGTAGGGQRESPR